MNQIITLSKLHKQEISCAAGLCLPLSWCKNVPTSFNRDFLCK